MKNIGIFYLIFVVMLSALPCTDELEDNYFAQSATLNIAHDLDAGEMEACYPICACTCCGQSLLETEISSFILKPALKFLDNQISNSQFSLQQRNNNIWNPPKTA